MKKYNWWTDPKNKEEIDKISWWNHPENKDFFNLPISVIQSDNVWVASFNEDTEAMFGDTFSGCAQGDSREDAIKQLMQIVQMSWEYSDDCRRSYERFVPFRKGDWKHIGGKWFSVFGFHVSFRYGKGMKYGAYIPFTKLNISISNHWRNYKRQPAK
jgi:hypothetical protein